MNPHTKQFSVSFYIYNDTHSNCLTGFSIAFCSLHYDGLYRHGNWQCSGSHEHRVHGVHHLHTDLHLHLDAIYSKAECL